MEFYIIIYLLLINLINFALMYVDKEKAKQRKYRIPEKAFFILALLGGAFGGWAGMYVFHHKTKHWYFVVFIPAILLVQIVAYTYFNYFL